MVDEKKTILMTKLAIFEKHEKNKSLVVSKYYRRDYVRYNVLKTWVAATILYWSIVAGYIFMAFDSILEQLNDLDYFGIVYKMLGGYVIVCLVYFLFATFLYNYRYQSADSGTTGTQEPGNYRKCKEKKCPCSCTEGAGAAQTAGHGRRAAQNPCTKRTA